jgi:hypothetical protein
MPRCSAETAIDASWNRAAVQERMKGSYAGRFECRRIRAAQSPFRFIYEF